MEDSFNNNINSDSNRKRASSRNIFGNKKAADTNRLDMMN